MSVRDDIATAATIADLTNVSPYYRQSSRPGDGSVRLDAVSRDDSGFGRIATWQVIVFLPQDQAAAEKWMDDHLTQLLDAIATELIVTSATPAQIPLDTGMTSALVIEGAREHN